VNAGYRGVVVPLVTPVTDDGVVAEADVAALVGSVSAHVDALMPALSTGEGWALSPTQWREMVAHTVRHAGGLPVVAGILRPSTAEVLAMAELAAQLGAQAVAVSTPSGATVSQEAMYAHYAELNSAAALPVVVYHENAVSGNALELETLLRVCRLRRMVAVKDSGGDAEFTRRLVKARPDVMVWQGFEHLPGDGVDGFALGLANIEPRLCAELYREPGEPARQRVVAASTACRLLDDDWYRNIKIRLCARGVISTPRVVSR
jgi:4-hydroxy-tetrahydrodipicolinate synthase